jgi:hypothetical protein
VTGSAAGSGPATKGHPSEAPGFPEEFDRIEAAVDAGRTDLGPLGFWRLLAKVKADPALASHWAEQAGRIDRTAFESSSLVRVPVWVGNVLSLAGILIGAAAVAIALGTESETLAGLLLVFAALDWSAAPHSIAHWLVGRIVGIRFTCYFLRSLVPPFPGVKIDYRSYLLASPGSRAWMHASGAIASKLGPLVALAFWPATVAPTWAAWVIVAYELVIIGTDVFISTRRSDWKRVRRELRISRMQGSGG